MFDTHVHIASDDHGRYPRRIGGFGSEWWRAGGHDVESLLRAMDGSGVERASVVQAVGVYGSDNSYVLDAVADHLDRLRAVVSVDIQPGVGDTIRSLADRPGVVGVRMFAVGAPGSGSDAWVGTHAFDEAMDGCRQRGLTAVLTVFPQHLSVLRASLLSSSDLPIVPVALDHCGFPAFDGARVAQGQPLLDLVGAQHVSLKVSSHVLQHVSDRRAVVEHLAELFGEDRLLWGSDYPQSGSGYSALLELALDAPRRFEGKAVDLFWLNSSHSG